jgi:hypothetical protein
MNGEIMDVSLDATLVIELFLNENHLSRPKLPYFRGLKRGEGRDERFFCKIINLIITWTKI